MRRIDAKPCKTCGAPSPRRVTPSGKSYWPTLCDACRAVHAKGETHYRWTGGRSTRHKSGYVRVFVAPGKERQFEHRAVWEAAHGPIPPGHHVHHLNGKKDDNRLENLVIVTNAEHQAVHRPERVLARWSLAHEACVACGTTERRHVGHGLCQRCLEREARRRRGVLAAAERVGERHPNAKLTEELVRWAREQAATGRSIQSIARELGVSRGTMRRVVTRVYWAHVP